MGYTLAGTALIVGGGYLTGQGPAGGLKPSPKRLPPVPPMPDINAQNQAQQLEEAKAAAIRQGRASTILTTPQTTGDRLGP